jgi:LysR family nod box-dependent transcriptional activator
MRLDRLDLNLLVALDALLTERHVTRAGEQLGLSQPAMSGALSRLRCHFEDPLVNRVGSKMILTPLGERLASPVRDLLLQIKAVLDDRHVFDPAQSHRHFSIVSSDFINALIMDRVSKAVAEQAPNITIEWLDPLAGRFSDDLENGDADILIIPRSLTTPEHPSQTLLTDRLVCVVWRENHEVGDRISLDDYLSRSHVSANFGRARIEGIEAVHLRSLGVNRRVVMSVPQFTALPQLVVGTQRIATIPKRLADLSSTMLPIRIVEPEIEFPPIEEIVQWHKYREDDPALRWLRGLLSGLAQAP